MRALFLLPSNGHAVARNFTHISLWQKAGGRSTVCAFSRGDDQPYKERINELLGKLDHGSLLKRIPVYKYALNKMVELSAEHDVIFVYTLDNFLLAWMGKVAARSDIKIVLFILDIRRLFIGNKLTNHIIQSFLLFAFDKCELILVSSRDYIEGYVAKHVKQLPDKWLEIENKIDPYVVDKSSDNNFLPPTKNDDSITIGYFGILRCQRSLTALLMIAEQGQGKFNIEIRGEFLGLKEAEQQISRTPNVNYLGRYKNPQDLSSIYNACDIIWACYPFETGESNQRWAKTNRFYEAGYFKKPIIVNEGSNDARFVVKAKNGLVIDLTNVNKAVSSILELNKQQLATFSSAYLVISPSTFEYSDEFDDLKKTLGFRKNS